jgi:RNA polymerase sigma-70 factor, ECF subfamily
MHAAALDHQTKAMDVRTALARLTPEHRQVIVEMYYLSRPVAEIATRLGVPEGTVKSRAYYGMRQLNGLLSAPYGDHAARGGALGPDGGCRMR